MPVWKVSRQVLANDQNTAGTWARTAWLSGRGVPSLGAARELGLHGGVGGGGIDIADPWLLHCDVSRQGWLRLAIAARMLPHGRNGINAGHALFTTHDRRGFPASSLAKF